MINFYQLARTHICTLSLSLFLTHSLSLSLSFSLSHSLSLSLSHTHTHIHTYTHTHILTVVLRRYSWSVSSPLHSHLPYFNSEGLLGPQKETKRAHLSFSKCPRKFPRSLLQTQVLPTDDSAGGYV